MKTLTCLSLAAVLLLTAVLLLGTGLQASEGPSFNVNWYGKIQLDATRDQNPTSGNYSVYALQQDTDIETKSLSITPRQSRLGLTAAGNGYGQFDINANLEFDFYGSGNGIDERATLRLRHAYFTVARSDFSLLAGQSYDLVSPLRPSMLNAGPMSQGGDMGSRRPQVTLSYTGHPNQQTDVTFSAGLFRVDAFDLETEVSLSAEEVSTDGVTDGAANGTPAFQGLIDLKHHFVSGGEFRGGFSTQFSSMRAQDSNGSYRDYQSHAVAAHLYLEMANGFGISGEVYSGYNLGKYNGNIGLSDTFEGLGSTGGWASAWYRLSPKFKLATGAGLDDPENNDLETGTRSKNQIVFGNLQYNPVTPVTMGIELSQYKTDYLDNETAKNIRVQSSFALKF